MTYLNYSFNPNQWSLTYQQFRHLIFLLNAFHPHSICEIGAGETTKIFNQYVNRYEGTSFLSIEHNEEYKQDNVVICNLVEHKSLDINNFHFDNVNYYEGLEDILKDHKFDLVLIDGPYSFDQSYKYARVQSLLFTENNLLDDTSIMIIHDYDRQNVKNMLELLDKSFDDNRYDISKGYLFNDGGSKQLIEYNILKKENADF